MNTKKTNIQFIIPLVIALSVGVGGFYLGRITQKPAITSGSGTQQAGEGEILYWQAPMDSTEIYDAPGQSKMGMDLVPVYADEETKEGAIAENEREIIYWQAPMNPTEIYEGPGQSAMGMDLIPVYADEAGSGSIVSIDPVTVQNMGVRSEKVYRMDFSRKIRTIGEVQYDEENLYQVNAKISGWIEKLHVNFVGEEVTAGQPLMDIYSPELVTTQEEYLLALRNAERMKRSSISSVQEDADKLLESARKRLEYWDIPAEEIERLRESGEVNKTVQLKAPATGIVIQKYAIEGAFIKAGMDLFRIADLRTVWVHASFYENEVPWISEGQPVNMELSYLPGREYAGRVSYIYPYLREKARDVHVRVIFSNPDLDLKPGMYANVELQGKVIPDALVVPAEAVIRSGERTLVFVLRGAGKFEPREIRIGEEGGPGNGYLRVLSGLLGGEEVVTSAQFMIDSESRLQEAIQKMLEARNQAGGMDKEPSEEPEMQDTMDHNMNHDH